AHGGRGDEAVTTAPEASAVKRVQDAIEVAEELIAAAGRNSAPFAAPLGELLEVIKVVVRATVACVRPAASHALPSVATTLTALVQATETAAQKVLDETDALHATQHTLRQALAQLDSATPGSGPAARAWREATESCEALSGHVGAIVSALAARRSTSSTRGRRTWGSPTSICPRWTGSPWCASSASSRRSTARRC